MTGKGPDMALNPTVQDVTQRIVDRSRQARGEYLDRMGRAAAAGPARAHLSCGNQACPPGGSHGNGSSMALNVDDSLNRTGLRTVLFDHVGQCFSNRYETGGLRKRVLVGNYTIGDSAYLLSTPIKNAEAGLTQGGVDCQHTLAAIFRNCHKPK